MPSTRRFFLGRLAAGAAAAACPAVVKEVVTSAIEEVVPSAVEVASQVVATPFIGVSSFSVTELARLIYSGESSTTNWHGDTITLQDVKDFASAKGLGFGELASRIATQATFCSRPVYVGDFANPIFALNAQNNTDLNQLTGEDWDRAVDYVYRMGYNVSDKGLGAPVWSSDDHLSIPRDVEFYKAQRELAVRESYSDWDGPLPDEAEALIRSEVFFDDEDAVRFGTTVHKEWDEETRQYLEVRVELILAPQAPRFEMEVQETFGPEFGFILRRHRFKF